MTNSDDLTEEGYTDIFTLNFSHAVEQWDQMLQVPRNNGNRKGDEAQLK